MTVIETAKLNNLDPQTYLADILDRIHDHKINRLDQLLPWNWMPLGTAMDSQAAVTMARLPRPLKYSEHSEADSQRQRSS